MEVLGIFIILFFALFFYWIWFRNGAKKYYRAMHMVVPESLIWPKSIYYYTIYMKILSFSALVIFIVQFLEDELNIVPDLMMISLFIVALFDLVILVKGIIDKRTQLLPENVSVKTPSQINLSSMFRDNMIATFIGAIILFAALFLYFFISNRIISWLLIIILGIGYLAAYFLYFYRKYFSKIKKS